jgi:hypothetical protein
MRTLLLRLMVIAALMFWQGGFTFYAAVVVPVGQRVLGSHLEQGFITREVTWYLNLAGGVCLAVLCMELVDANGSPQLKKWQWALCAALAATLAALVWGRVQLDTLIDLEGHGLLERAAFRTRHRMYLWASTLQWGLGLSYLILTLKRWQLSDRQKGEKCA